MQNAKIVPVAKINEEFQKINGNSVEFTTESDRVNSVATIIRKGIFDPSRASLIQNRFTPI